MKQMAQNRPVTPGEAAACSLLLVSLALTPFGAAAQDNNRRPGPDLTQVPIEALMEMEVTSVARRSEKISQSPAAVTVITQDDIWREGALTIPDALRLVPGLEVARLDANQMAVSVRGFNDVFANKLLVIQDGRSIYTPLFSGVFWDVQGTLMEDIERIEVIRGPGATLWGANAVNGVINIMTRSAKDTQGTLLSAGGGTDMQAFAGARYGAKISDNAWFRIYGQYMEHDDSPRPDGQDARDGYQIGRGGFRVDWDVSEQNLLTLQGDIYRGAMNQTFNTFDPSSMPTLQRVVQDNFYVGGGNVITRFSHQISPDSDLSLQMYYDRTERHTVIFGEDRDTFDADFQYRVTPVSRNELVLGLEYRFTRDRVSNSPTISLMPDRRTVELFSAFVQDEITLVEDWLRLTLGSKFEQNDFTGFEFQPGGRLLWTPTPHQTIWGSVTRAVRTPSRAEDDIVLRQSQQVGPGFYVPVTIMGARSFLSEELIAYEVGYRTQPWSRLSFDIAAFYNDYDRLRSLEADPRNPTLIHTENKLYGYTYGTEVSATLELAQWWRLQPGYSYLSMHISARPGSTDANPSLDEGKNPRHQAFVRSSMDLPQNVFLDCTLRYVDNLPSLGIDSYVTADVHLAWRPTKNLELSVVGQNLLDDRHAEFRPSFIQTAQTEVPRGFYGKVTVRF
jgi:iron complex outermembrane receptor protein